MRSRLKKKYAGEQMRFTETGEVIRPTTIVVEPPEDPRQSVANTQCPFCLYQGVRNEFVILGKKGPSFKRYQCPDCKVIMYKYTLEKTIDMPISDYASWVFVERQYDMTGKLKWDKIKARLAEQNLSKQFWYYYYKAKEKDIEENPEKYARSYEARVDYDKEYEEYAKAERERAKSM